MGFVQLLKRVLTGVGLLGIFWICCFGPYRLPVLLLAIFAASVALKEFVMIRTRMIQIHNRSGVAESIPDDESEEGESGEAIAEDMYPPSIMKTTWEERRQVFLRMVLAAGFPLFAFYIPRERLMSVLGTYILGLVVGLNFLTMVGIVHWGPARRAGELRLSDFIATQLDIFALVFFGGSVACGVAMYKESPFWLAFVCLGVSACDVGGLAGGKGFGKKDPKTGKVLHALSPVLSPNKTIEGAIGAVICTILGGFILRYVIPIASFTSTPVVVPTSPRFYIVFGLVMAVCGIYGDLFESYFKRVAKVKDSGRLLGTHGGILDRADAILFSFPVIYLLRETGLLQWVL